MKKKSKVIKHLKGDIKTFKHEAHEDRELIKSLKKKSPKKSKAKKHAKKKHAKKKVAKKHKETKHEKSKVSKVMREFKHGQLHSGSKKGPKVTNPRQAIAISLSEAGLSRKKKKRKK